MMLNAPAIRTTPLTECFGVIVDGVNLSNLTDGGLFAEVRGLFEEHSALLFRNQSLTDEEHLRLAAMFGPIEDRSTDERRKGEGATVSPVSNQMEDGTLTGEMDMHTLHLKANQLWHIDSTFMPTPSLCNILTAKVVPSSGGETELASTRAAWAEMPEILRTKIHGKVLRHSYKRSRQIISAELAEQPLFSKWPPQRWPAVWMNPVNGLEALFIASHVYQIEGVEDEEGEALVTQLLDYCTQPRFVYSHKWAVGDVLIWDQRSVLHRGRPWPYDEPRTLASVCCSMQEKDGLDAARKALKEIR